MKKLLIILILGMILGQTDEDNKDKEVIKITSVGTGNLTFARLVEYNLSHELSSGEHYNDHINDVQIVHTKYISIGMRVLDKINVDLYRNTSSVPYLYQISSSYNQYTKSINSYGISFKKDMFNNIDIIIGLYESIVSRPKYTHDISYNHDYHFEKIPLLFLGMNYNIKIYKEFYIPIGIKGVIPFAFRSGTEKTYHTFDLKPANDVYANNILNLVSPLEISIGIGHKSGFGF